MLSTVMTMSASDSFDADCEFFRMDNTQVSLAFQLLPRADGSKVKILGVSAEEMRSDFVSSLIRRTATRQIAAQTFNTGSETLMQRLSELVSGL
jgi:hypothetical protein